MFSFVVFKLILLLVQGRSGNHLKEHSGDYCDTEIFRAECNNQEEIIVMTSAKYGRMKVGRCVEHHLGYIDCYTDVITIIDRRCSGKNKCHVRVPDAELENTRPCLKELKTYMEASYLCVPATIPRDESSCLSPTVINTSSTLGYISLTSQTSAVTSSTPITCSWSIMGKPGQTINITLFDFNVHLGEDVFYRDKDQSRPMPPCRQIGWLNDGNDEGDPSTVHLQVVPRNIPVCARNTRISNVYISKSNLLKLWLHTTFIPNGHETQNPISAGDNYLIQYKLSGCPDPTNLPVNSWWKKENDGSLVVGCFYDNHKQSDVPKVVNEGHFKWILHCVKETWTGTLGNCSETGSFDASQLNSSDDVVISYGLAIAIGAVIGVLIATGIVLIVGFVRDKNGHASVYRSRDFRVERSQSCQTKNFDQSELSQPSSTFLNYERSTRDDSNFHESIKPRDFNLHSSTISKLTESRYTTRNSSACPYHQRLHHINSGALNSPPYLDDLQPMGFYSSARSLPRYGDSNYDEANQDGTEQKDMKCDGSIFTVVEPNPQQQNCLC